MNEKASSSPIRTKEEVTLSRDFTLFRITMIGIGGMIGAGIFVLTGIAAGVAGPALVLAFLLNGILTTFTAFSYAELGSVFPEAGGSYLWVKEGLGGTNGFLAGWMSWFALSVAGSLCALGFGRFATELWKYSGLTTFGLSISQMTLILMALIILIFTAINYRGASEMGRIGTMITLTKVVILGLFVTFGVLALLRTDAWHTRFTIDFMPDGIFSFFVAMGLAFIAFVGYEIIAQSGEEVIDPKRNTPRAIFLSIGVVVVIYLLVSITALGATNPPSGMLAYQYLGDQKEIAIVQVARQVFPRGVGGILLLFCGIVSTMSALNATMYSSSRVSFAMGRDHNLPEIFAKIHPITHTPHWAVILSGGLMLIIALSLPIEDVAAAASIMFLTLFLQVNIAVLAIRRRLPHMERGFRIPWMPAIPIIAILANALLALSLFSFSPIAWCFALGWIIVGMLAYYTHFSKIEAVEKHGETSLDEVLISRRYSVVVPVATQEQARILGRIGAILASDNNGEVLALHVIRVPPQLDLGEGRLMLKDSRPLLKTVIHQANKINVPVHTVLRLGRNVAKAIRKTIEEKAPELLVLGWPGYTNSAGRIFGSVIDPIIDEPPADLAIVRYRAYRSLKTILVPVGGGPHSRKAVKMAVSMARSEIDVPVQVTLLHVIPTQAGPLGQVRAEQVFRETLEGIDYKHIDRQIVAGSDIADTVVTFSKGRALEEAYDLIVIGATNEPFFKNLLVGNLSQRVAKEADVTVIVVKRRSSRLHTLLRQTVHDPSVNRET